MRSRADARRKAQYRDVQSDIRRCGIQLNAALKLVADGVMQGLDQEVMIPRRDKLINIEKKLRDLKAWRLDLIKQGA
jgi:hypothetical protein